MVVQMPTMRADAPESELLPAGLDVHFADGSRLSADQPVEAAPADPLADHIDTGEVERFLGTLRRLTRIEVDTDPGQGQLPEGTMPDPAIHWIRNTVQTAIEAQRDRERHLQLREPPFIAGLRELIQQMTLQPRIRRKHVQVRFLPGGR